MTALRRGKPVPEIKVMEETMMVCEDLANLFVKVTLRQKKQGKYYIKSYLMHGHAHSELRFKKLDSFYVSFTYNLIFQREELPKVLDVVLPQMAGSSETAVLNSLLPRMPVIKDRKSPSSSVKTSGQSNEYDNIIHFLHFCFVDC